MIGVVPLKEPQSHERHAFLQGQPAGLFVHSSAYRRGSRIWNWGATRRGMAGAAPGELMGRFPGFYVLPFSALHSSCV